MTNYRPLFYTLGIILLIAGVLSLILSSINIDSSTANPNSFITGSILYGITTDYIGSSLIDTIDTGISIFGIDISIPIINPLAFLGSSTQDFIIGQINTLTYLPNVIIIPLFIFFILATLWTAVKIIIP